MADLWLFQAPDCTTVGACSCLWDAADFMAILAKHSKFLKLRVAKATRVLTRVLKRFLTQSTLMCTLGQGTLV